MKAISLFSGGLDSQLAVSVIKEQGIEVAAVNFVTPFFGGQTSYRQYADQLGIEYHEINIGDTYMDVLKNPVYGYGKNLNPCIDCHAFMLKNAGQFMEEIGAQFIITGEVLGQRPMSQNKSSLITVEKLSGYKGYIIRPLSAQLLEPTIPEIEGWVDRSKLLNISGRGRSRQMELADHFGLKDFPTPAGGCLLTDASFSNRLRRILAVKPDAGPDELGILKVGRHFYLENDLLFVVGRDHGENERIESLANKGDILLKVADRPGPLGLIRALYPHDEVDLEIPAKIVARYSDARDLSEAQIIVNRSGSEETKFLTVVPMQPSEVPTTI